MQMIKEEYAIAYRQVLEILNHIPQEDYKKIPKEIIEAYKSGAKKEYRFNYNPDKTLKEQNVSNITEVILAGLYRDYWATETQRARIINRQNYERRKIEQQKEEKYRYEDIFKKDKDNENECHEKDMVVIEKKHFLSKIFTKIKLMFMKNK